MLPMAAQIIVCFDGFLKAQAAISLNCSRAKDA